MEPLISHTDVTTIIRLVADIHDDVRQILSFLEEDDGEEEDSEADG